MPIIKSARKLVYTEKFYHFLLVLANGYLALSAILFLVYLIAPLFGGKLSHYALIVYASWIGMALAMKYLVEKMQKKVRLKVYELLPICLYYIICMFIWFGYPLNIIFSIGGIIGIVVGYKAQQKSSLFLDSSKN